jgi:hypothetical protein
MERSDHGAVPRSRLLKGRRLLNHEELRRSYVTEDLRWRNLTKTSALSKVSLRGVKRRSNLSRLPRPFGARNDNENNPIAFVLIQAFTLLRQRA